MNMKTAFTDRLQTALTATGTSREKLAAHLGVSFSTIRRWLNGVCAPDVYQFREIARFFGVSYDWFLEDAGAAPDAEELAVKLGLSPDTVSDLLRMAKTESPEVLRSLDGAVRNVISAVDAVYDDLFLDVEESFLESLMNSQTKENAK